ncbi:hypothetical protein JWJ88_07440 [Paracoccus methylovorus]|uniref:Helix-turn-helix domain-containing protein n=1 Tax=Paracoccus methylovorus TaxID=2812658 RepID=A0ABX7JE20_9RHOB|nr:MULTISPECIES: hypothetical protein [Paracoccus]QRZ12450.1 hypothetical protein JWJ88_07440 [Paracoccus methylovorus]
MAPQVHVDSLPADLREAWYLSQGIKLDEAVDPATGEVRKLPEAVTQHDPKWDERVAVAQWRLNIIRQVAAQPKGSPARKAALDVLAGQIQVLPDGKRKVLSRSTLYNWIAAYDAGGLLGLMPETRKDAGQKKTIVTMVWDGFFSGRITPPDHQRIGDDVAHYIRRAASLRRADPAAKPL